MIVYTVIVILFAASFITQLILSHMERNKLIELLAAKDYADYKNFDLISDNKSKGHMNMFEARKRNEQGNNTDI